MSGAGGRTFASITLTTIRRPSAHTTCTSAKLPPDRPGRAVGASRQTAGRGRREPCHPRNFFWMPSKARSSMSLAWTSVMIPVSADFIANFEEAYNIRCLTVVRPSGDQ